MLKAVIFDVDGVLINSLEANTKFYQDLFAAAGYDKPSKSTIRRLFHLTMEGVIREILGPNNHSEITRIWRMGHDRVVGYPDKLVKTPLGMVDTVKKLGGKFALGIVTSRVRNGVYTLPQLAAIEKYIQVTVCFEDTASHKPDPEPLQFACKKLLVEPSEAVYIGDTKTDVLAAKAAGMKVVIFSESKIPHADICTDNFRKIAASVFSL
jgi:pyrophosphatase PpaX